MKKTKKYILLLLISIISCKNTEREKIKIETVKDSTKIEVKSEPKITVKTTNPKTNSNDTENIKEEQIIKENENTLKLKFTKIKSTEYFDYKQKYSNGITIDTTITNKAGSSFTLPLKNTEKTFSCDIDFNVCTYYKGFIKSLNKYVLTYCGQGYCGTYLLDKNTGETNSLESPFDSECESPVLSKNESQLIAFSSSVFDTNSFLSLYENNPKTKIIDFTIYKFFNSSEWKINEIIWIDEKTIALIIYDEYGGETGSELINKRYLKAIIQ